MEPRGWKWIQAAVIAVAMALGLWIAFWYQNRPVNEALPAAVAMPNRKMIRHPAHPDVIPNVAPLTPVAGTADTASTGIGGDGAHPALAVPVPSQSSVNSWQHAAVDPMAHLRITPLSGAAPTGAAPTGTTSPTASPVPPIYGVAPNTASSVPPFTTLPGSPAAVPPSSPATPPPPSTPVPPQVNTSPTPGTPPAASVSPFSGTPPAAPSATPGL